MTNQTLRVGVASFAHGHAYSYAAALQGIAGAALAGVWDDDPARAAASAARYGTPRYEQLDDLLAACDALVVAAANAHHHELVLAAARAGVHVLCEKPLATTPADALAMVRACEAAGVLLGTAFPVRYSPAVRRLRAAVQAGALGETLAIRTTNRGTYPGGWFGDPRLAGGGALVDHIVHVADLLRWIWGREIVEVYAEAATRHYDLPVDDCGLLLIRMEGGAIASLDPSWSRPAQSYPTWGDVTLAVTGTGGSAEVDVFAQHVELYSNRAVRARRVPWGDDLDALLIADWLAAVRDGRPAPVSGLDGLRTVEVVAAAYESARTNAPVAVQHAST